MARHQSAATTTETQGRCNMPPVPRGGSGPTAAAPEPEMESLYYSDLLPKDRMQPVNPRNSSKPNTPAIARRLGPPYTAAEGFGLAVVFSAGRPASGHVEP
ncbi:hypothetical protein LBMAG47_00150 [Planctomycetia bacterium]|nr:hypothetical protein LBMAG47_00150 [Planctomycetia bacterium]